MRVELDGRTFQGTELQIVQAMRSIAFRNDATIGEYMRWMSGQLEMLGPKVEVDEDDATTARNLVAAMVECGLATKH
jgi:hypothetical protein